MTKIYNTVLVLFSLVFILTSCEDVLQKTPLDKLSDDSFWSNENDATLALIGVYNVKKDSYGTTDWWNYQWLCWSEFATDNAFDRRGNNSDESRLGNGNLLATTRVVQEMWQGSYRKIARCNYFLENIEGVEFSDSSTKTEMIAEVRAIRAMQYFYITQHWGDAPFTTTILTIDEANTIDITPKATIVDFVLSELKTAAADIPNTRPASERGRLVSAAALAFRGRLLMAENRWEEAAADYKTIIDQQEFSIEQNFTYNELFKAGSEASEEMIFSIQKLVDDPDASHWILQHLSPYIASGWHIFCPVQSLVDAYEYTDGLSKNQSALVDPTDDFANRDPRLAMSILRHGALFKGKTYEPFTDGSDDRMPSKSKTGFCSLKYLDEDYNGNLQNYGGHLPVVRYAEILLSYLESKLEAGDPITQDLLDATINEVRGRASVQMPPVTDLDTETLRTRLRNERRVEFAFEGLRYWDLIRWRVAHQIMQGDRIGARVPADGNGVNNGKWNKTSEGYLLVQKDAMNFTEKNYVWPYPQVEVDINPKLDNESRGY